MSKQTAAKPEPRKHRATRLPMPARAEAKTVAPKGWGGIGWISPRVRHGGRKPVEIKLAQVERCASIGCLDEEIAAVIGISSAAWHVRKANDPTIQEAIDRGREGGRATLRRLQWQGAHAGNTTMLVWLGKQLLGQSDKAEFGGMEGKPIEIKDASRLEVARRLAFLLSQGAEVAGL